MKAAFKNFLDFILSFIKPKKMIRYRNINLFLIVLIFLGCMLLCSGVSNLSLINYVKRNKENFRLYPEVYNLEYEGGIELPKFSINDETGGMTNFSKGSEEDNVYEIKFNLEDGKTLNLTIVYEDKVFVNDDEKTPHDDRLTNFDLNGYYNYLPKRNENGELLEQDMLLIINNELIYYMFNHGTDTIMNESGNYNRYLESTGWDIMESKFTLPKDESEIVYKEDKTIDYSKWTLTAKRGETVTFGDKTYYAHKTGERAYFLPNDASELVENAYGVYDIRKWTLPASENESKFINNVEYKAECRLSPSVHEIYVSNSTTRVGVFSLYQAKQLGVNFGDIENGKYPVNPAKIVEGIATLMVNSGANQLQYYNFFYAIIFIIFMPLLWTFATWAMGKKYGELTRFKEYYAICSVSFIVPSILVALFTIFVQPYAFIAQYAMFIQVAFYIFCIFKMNNVTRKPENKNNNNNGNNNNQPKKEEVVDLEVQTENVQERVARTAQME